jgi:cytochrome c biogenesis protein
VAIVLASLATAIAIAGSLLMQFNPQVFAGLDNYSFLDWQRSFGHKAPLLSSWFYLTGVMVLLLAANTLCCFIDWLLRFRSRWRKTGEYLIHLGFVLVVIAYFWGSFAGDRAHLSLRTGEVQPLPTQPGYFLRLDSIAPVIGTSGRPIDLLHNISVLHGDSIISSTTLHANTPLFINDATIVASGSDQQIIGFNVILPDLGYAADLTPGAIIRLNETTDLRVNAIHSDANNAYVNLTLFIAGETVWQGWYSSQQPVAAPLRQAGFNPIIRRPLLLATSELTINHDPGLRIASIGSILLTLGVVVALFSFYAKRRRGDRPEIR